MSRPWFTDLDIGFWLMGPDFMSLFRKLSADRERPAVASSTDRDDDDDDDEVEDG